MAELQTDEKVLLVKFYFQCGESVASAIRHFCTTKNIKRKDSKPNFSSVKRIIIHFLESGSVHVTKRNSKRRSLDEVPPF